MNNQESNTIRMTCQECGGTMDIDKDKTILCCPYCGSKKLIIESDAVRIERIKAEHEKEMFNTRYNSQVKLINKTMMPLIIILGVCFLILLILGVCQAARLF